MTPARVLIVDDSVVIRRLLSDILDADPDVEVVGTASNGRIGLDRIEQLSPDLVTLDIEMPELDGLQTLVELRRSHPDLPVIMFSTLTERGAAATIEALANGANDYVTKPANVGKAQAAMAQVHDSLLPKVKALTGRADAPAEPPRLRARQRPWAADVPVSIVAIGSSTGGPNALETVLRSLRPDFPVPIVIAQHMPPTFTRLLAERLDQKTALTVTEAVDGEELAPGHAYVAPGGQHLEIRSSRRGIDTIALTEDPPENFCRPAVDVLFRSVAATHGPSALGLVLTGMGQDGRTGSRHLVDAGGEVYAQDRATSVVWGMPGYVATDGTASQILPLDAIGHAIEDRVRPMVSTNSRGAR